MSKKSDYKEIPKTLAKHQFYGLQLDDEQICFRDAIWDSNKLIVFCNSKSGSGKTTIATGTANLLCEYGLYNGIVYIATPIQEQRQGFLKGSLEEKSVPYFEPFYQALIRIGVNINIASYGDINNLKNGTAYIETMTHTFLRGTNFENKVVIIDESQNFSVDELQKVLTRIHDSCKTLVLGHTGQIDIESAKSGFEKYIDHFKDDERTAICTLNKNYRGWISSHADEIGNIKRFN